MTQGATEKGVLALPVLAQGTEYVEATGPESAHRIQRPGELGIGLECAFGRRATG
jgi:hypothetical protein